MTILERLHKIEKAMCIYDIHYCKAGVGFIFYYPEKDTIKTEDSWRKALSVENYYPTFEKAVNAEYKKLIDAFNSTKEEGKK